MELGFGSEPADVRVRKGGVAKFHCAVFGPAPLTISWRKDGLPLLTDNARL